MRQTQYRFHVYTYSTSGGCIVGHYRTDHWPSVKMRLRWLKANRPDTTTRVKDINFDPLGKHQRDTVTFQAG